ncbi:hypothetical protein [Streptomyces albidus (ex Kaewkla and Franco 2022)]|uniref:hypothetical protein n=1 Tax=Streptomyces albidus (ex Kaewkla and Franco 2022) TaxID=722709 RepID=UPI0015EF389C|nr:hypothetical protein [Streptomyces albidus (ex Kaewkla and Franco 2022)]
MTVLAAGAGSPFDPAKALTPIAAAPPPPTTSAATIAIVLFALRERLWSFLPILPSLHSFRVIQRLEFHEPGVPQGREVIEDNGVGRVVANDNTIELRV